MQTSYEFENPGQKTVVDYLECECGDVFLATAQLQVEVVDQCSASYVDDDAEWRLSSYFSQAPYEYGTTFICVADSGGNYIDSSTYIRNSFSSGNTNDPCKVSLAKPSNWRAFGHTHPYFTSQAQYNAGNGCFDHSGYISTGDLMTINELNRYISEGDENAAENLLQGPLYLGTPLRDAVRVYKQNPTFWQEVTIWP